MDSELFSAKKNRHTRFFSYCVYLLLFIFPTWASAEIVSSLSPGQVQQQLQNTVNMQQEISARGPAFATRVTTQLFLQAFQYHRVCVDRLYYVQYALTDPAFIHKKHF